MPQERLKAKPAKNEQKIEIQSVEVVNFETVAVADDILYDQTENPKVIVTPVAETAKFVPNQAEVYEIKFVHIPTMQNMQ